MAVIMTPETQLYRGTYGEHADIPCGCILAYTVKLDSDTSDANIRENTNWKRKLCKFKNMTWELNILCDNNSTDPAFFQQAYFSQSPFSLFLSNNEGNGIEADFTLQNLILTGKENDPIRLKMTTRSFPDIRDPDWRTGNPQLPLRKTEE